LVRPESATAQATWLQVTLLNHAASLENQRLIQLRDVTAQMSLQRNMRTFQDALSHKLRTPLAHIVTSLEILADEDDSLTVDRVEVFKMALRGARRLHHEIKDILHYLDVSRSRRGELGCGLAEFQQIVAAVSSNLELAPITISDQDGLEEVQFALSCPALEWVVWEILENAKKFHPQGSPVVQITISRSGENAVSLRFSDNGLALSPEQLAQAWLPYDQGEKYFTGEAAGMGLGLPTVASLVWEVGGTCHLYNRDDGPGVVVELTIPIGRK
jgi:K+-sensing histidine kinase KdpD